MAIIVRGRLKGVNHLAPKPIRNGFALALVLWAIAFLGAIGLAINENVRLSASSTNNRSGLIKARWIAEGCAALALASIDSSLEKRDHHLRDSIAWWRLSEIVLPIANSDASACKINFRPDQGGLDLNAVDSSQLGRVFRVFGVDQDHADHFAHAILQWRLNESGAVQKRFSSISELNEIGGFAALPSDIRRQVQLALNTESASYSLLNGNESAFRALAGVEPEAVVELRKLREETQYLPQDSLQRVLNISTITSRLRSSARDSMVAHQRDLAAITAIGPGAWVLDLVVPFTAETGTAANYRLSLILRRIATRAVVVRQRSWP